MSQESAVSFTTTTSESKATLEVKQTPAEVKREIEVTVDTPLQNALREFYKKRVQLHSILFLNQTLPLEEVHFTLHESKELEEKARAAEFKEEEKESKESKEDDSSLEFDTQQSIAPQTLTFSELFKPLDQSSGHNKLEAAQAHDSQKPIQRLLITGDAGSGKTTLSKRIADDWIQRKGGKPYLFWLPLRALMSAIQEHPEEWASSPLPLATAIHQLCLDEAQQQAVGLKAIMRALTTPGEALLVLDGYDEVAQAYEGAQPGDPVKTVLDMAFNSDCALLVTSRGYSIPPSHISFDRRLVNQGFTDEQVESYVNRYFKSLGQEELGQQIFRLIRDNGQLWQQVHTPLILTLVCDIYRNAHENHQKLEELSLLDLYDGTLKVFIRRYLDWQSKWLGKPKLAWEKTKDHSLDELVAECPIEIQFLEKLSFAGIEKGVQRIDSALKQQVSKELQKDYKGKALFIQALKLGFLYEFPGPQASALDRNHEFVHLTFQEYFAARNLVACLQRRELTAYAWIRAHKYQPSAREVLNFVCMQMEPKTYPEFWRVLLEEQEDVTGLGHVQLVMHSIETQRCDKFIPSLQKHLEVITRIVVRGVCWGLYHYRVSRSMFIRKKDIRSGHELYETVAKEVVNRCPAIVQQFSEEVWDEIIRNGKSRNIGFYPLLNIRMQHWDKLDVDQQDVLVARLFSAFEDAPLHLAECRQAVVQALSKYMTQINRFTADWRSRLLNKLSKLVVDKDKHKQEIAVSVLRSSLLHIGIEERNQFLKILSEEILELIFSRSENIENHIQGALNFYFEQISVAKEKAPNQLLANLFKATAHTDPNVQSTAVQILVVYAKNKLCTVEERRQVLATLLRLIEEVEPNAREAVAEALREYVNYASYLSVEEQRYLLSALLKARDGTKHLAIQTDITDALLNYALQAIDLGKLPSTIMTISRVSGTYREFISFMRRSVVEMGCAQPINCTRQEWHLILKNLLTTVFTMRGHGDLSWLPSVICGMYMIQIEKFNPEERRQLLEMLLLDWPVEVGDLTLQYEVISLYGAHMGSLHEAERNSLRYTLLEAANSEDGVVKQRALKILSGFILPGKCSKEENNELLLIFLKSAQDEILMVRIAAIEALQYCVTQISWSQQARMQSLAQLIALTADKEKWVKGAAIMALAFCATQSMQPKEVYVQALGVLISASEDSATRRIAVSALTSCASHAMQYDTQGRAQLLAILLEPPEKSIDRRMAEAIVEYMKAIEADIKEKSELLETLFKLITAAKTNILLKEIVCEALGAYIAQAKNLSNQIRIRLLTALIKLLTSDRQDVQKVALAGFEAYIKHAGKLTSQESCQLLAILLKLGVGKDQRLCSTACSIFDTFVEQAHHRSPEERQQLLLATFNLFVSDKRSRFRKSVDDVSWKSAELVAISYKESYNVLQQMLEGRYFLTKTPISQLLEAYAKDETSLTGNVLTSDSTLMRSLKEKTGTTAGLRPRNALWLQFVVERAYREGVSIVVQDNSFILTGAQYRTPFIVPIPEKNRASLIKNLKAAFAEKAKSLALPVAASPMLISLPAEVKSQPIVRVDAEFEAQLIKLVADQSQQKMEIKSIRVKVEQHDKRLDQVESTLGTLQVQVKQHDAALQAQQEALQAFKEQARTTESELQTSIAAAKKELDRVGASVAEQEAALSQLAESVTTRFQEWEKEEAKREALYNKRDKELFEKQEQLSGVLTKIQQDIAELEAADASSGAALKALQARQNELSRAYEENQKRLAEREHLLSHPHLAKFYRVMHLKLSGFFLVCTVVSTGLIKAESQASLSEKITSKVVGVLGDNIPVPGAKAAASFINSMIVWHSEKRTEEGRGRAVEAAPVSFSEKEVAIDLTIQEVIRRYGQHICVLTEQSVEELAECAVNRIAHGIQQQEQAENMEFPLRMVQYLHQVKLKQGKLGHKDVATINGIVPKGQKPWNEDGIFRRTGIQSARQYYYSDKVEQHVLLSDKPICRYEKYAFRRVDDDKLAAAIAQSQGFDKVSVVPPANSFKFKPEAKAGSLTAPQGPASMFGRAKQAAIAVAKDKLQEAGQNAAQQISTDPHVAGAVVKSAAGFIADKTGEMVNSVYSGLS